MQFGGGALISLPDLLCFGNGVDKCCLRCLFYPMSICLFILCIYPSVEISGTRGSFSVFFSWLHGGPALLFCTVEAPSWIGTILLALGCSPGCTLTTQIHLSGLPESYKNPFGFVSLRPWGLPILGAADVRYLTSATWASRPAPTPKTKPPFLATGHKDQITAAF